jgi:hypothetical protein
VLSQYWFIRHKRLNRIRSQLSRVVKAHMRMRRRTSTKRRSITLVVRRRRRCAEGSRNMEKEFLQIAFQTLHRARRYFPRRLPFSKVCDCLLLIRGLVDEFGLLQTGPLRDFEPLCRLRSLCTQQR